MSFSVEKLFGNKNSRIVRGSDDTLATEVPSDLSVDSPGPRPTESPKRIHTHSEVNIQ